MSNSENTNGSALQGAQLAAAGSTGSSVQAESHNHGLAHTTPVKLLVAVFFALIVLTALTVAVTSVDLGAQWNLVAAMVIATLKAGLVVVFFMHLLWDKKFNLLLFLSSVLFLILFLSLTLNDRSEYQSGINDLETATQTVQP